MHVDPFDAQAIGDQAGVLPCCTAERDQGVAGHVVPALDRDLLDGIRHVLDGDRQEALGDLLGGTALAGGRGNLVGHGLERGDDRRGIEWLITTGTEHRREVLGPQIAEKHVAVGDGEGPSIAVGRRPRVGARRLRTHTHPASVEANDRTSTRGDGVDVDHRGPYPYAGDLGFEDTLELACVVGDVGGRTAHVEADLTVEARGRRRLDHADDATGRSAQERVLALEAVGIGQPTVRLHEHELGPGPVGTQPRIDPVDIASQDRRQVGVDHRGVAPRHQLHQRVDLVAHRYLREPDLTRERADRRLVLRVAIAVQQHDRHRLDPRVPERDQRVANRRLVQRHQHLAGRRDPLVDLDHLLVDHVRHGDVERKEIGPGLIADAKGVGEPTRRHVCRARTLALEQGVRRHRRAHAHRIDLLDRERVGRAHTEQVPDSGDRCVVVVTGILRQQLVGHRCPIGTSCDDVGERATPIDPELPAGHDPIVRARKHALTTSWDSPGSEGIAEPASRGQILVQVLKSGSRFAMNADAPSLMFMGMSTR